MFQEKVKVLLFEDNPGDVLLIREMFKEEVASRLELTQVARLADGIKLLSEQGFDAVLLDLNLPDSIGIATARMLKQNAPNLPIVILTSLADESIALEAIQLGMEDYLVKGQITAALLAHALRYAIERKRVEKVLRESEAKYRLLVEQSLLGIFIIQDGRIVYVNRVIAEKIGYSIDEAISLSTEQLQKLIHPDDRDLVWSRMFSRLSGNPEPERYECRFITTDGSMIWVDMNTGLIEYLGRPAIQIFVVDITERKKAEEALRASEKKMRSLFENSPDIIMIIDREGKLLFINRARAMTDEETLGTCCYDYIYPEDRQAYVDTAERVFQTGIPYTMQTRDVGPEGRMSWYETRFVSLESGGSEQTLMLIATDVTERKKTEEALRENEQKLRLMFEAMEGGIFVVALDGTVMEVNDGLEKITGFGREQLIGQSGLDYIFPGFGDDALGMLQKVISRGGVIKEAELVIKTAAGKAIYCEASSSILRDVAGNPIGLIGVLRDISERKRAAKALQASEERYRLLAENATDVIWVAGMDMQITYVSPSVTRLLGYTVEEVLARTMAEAYTPDSFAAAMQIFDQEMALERTGQGDPQRSRILEMELYRKDGTTVPVEANFSFIRDAGSNLVGILAMVRDITERNKAEEALRNSEEKLRVMFDSMMDGILVSDQSVKIVDVNRAILEMLDVKTKDELIGRSPTDVISFKNPEEAIGNLVKMLLEQHPQEKVDYSIVLSDGRDMEVEVSTAMMHDSAGNMIGFINAIRDVTERKHSEEALKKSEEKYRNLVEREKDVICSVDTLGFMKSVNSAVKMWGYTEDEVLKMNFLDLIAPEWHEVTAKQMQEYLLEAGEYVGETMVVNKNGEHWPIEYSAVVIYDEKGQYAGAQAIVRDISERKRAEEALQAKERYFRAITDLSSGAALLLSMDGNIVDVTGGLERISGHTREETIGRLAIEFIHPEDLEKAVAAFDEALRNPGKTVAFEARLKNVRGEWQWTESMITNLKDHRDVRGIVNHLVDITERKKTQEDIERHAKRIETLYAIAKVISQASTIDAMLGEALDMVCDVTGMECGGIFMLDYDDRALELKACKGLPESIVLKISTIVVTEQGIEGLMDLTKPIIDLDETKDVVDADTIREVVTESGRKALVAVPFFRGKDFQGLIALATAQERTFSRDDLDLLVAIANELAIGINNLMLLEKTRDLSVTDELTGLYNRRHFFEMLDVEMNRAARINRPFCLVMLDLDGFKEYNDKFGHVNGDAALQSFSQILKESIRKSDLAFRYGGDEFALILPTADAERAKQIIRRTRSIWKKSPMTQSPVFGGHVDFSTGIAEYPANAESADGLVFLSDAALYQAKRKGGHADKLVSELSTLSSGILDMATQDQVYALAATVDARDPYTYGHSQRVAEITRSIGRAIGMAGEDLAKVHAAALLHDIGKVGVPDSILAKMGEPTEEEWLVIKKHSAEGARIVSYVKELESIVPIILHHHEWYDGTGYPDGLKGIDIPLGARITSIADAYDTMVTKRPYRDVISPKKACKELRQYAGTQFDPALVDVWCKLVEEAEKKK